MKSKSIDNFEQAVQELELIVSQIDGSELALEQALEKYQRGIELVKFCQDKLTQVEQQVKILDTDSDTLKNFND